MGQCPKLASFHSTAAFFSHYKGILLPTNMAGQCDCLCAHSPKQKPHCSQVDFAVNEFNLVSKLLQTREMSHTNKCIFVGALCNLLLLAFFFYLVSCGSYINNFLQPLKIHWSMFQVLLKTRFTVLFSVFLC